MDKEILINLIPPTITLIVTSLFGLLVGVLIEKFKNRYRTITYQISTQKVRPSLSENLGEQLRINLGDREINTLKVAAVHINNKSSIDIENVVVNFSLSKNSWFHGNEGFLQNNPGWVVWTKSYNDYYQQVLDDHNVVPINEQTGIRQVSNELQKRIDFVLANREYFIPVFNRKETATFKFLIQDPEDDSESFIRPSIIHKSINFKEDVLDESQSLRELAITITIGLVFTAGVIAVIIANNQDHTSLIVLSAVIGISYSVVGFLIYHGYKRIRSFFS